MLLVSTTYVYAYEEYPYLECYVYTQPAIGHQPSRSAVWDRAVAGLLLFVDSFINRYLLVSGSVRVSVRQCQLAYGKARLWVS